MISFDALVGHVKLNSWFEYGPNDTLIGVGESIKYDKHGAEVSRSVSPTGVVVQLNGVDLSGVRGLDIRGIRK